VIEVIGSLRSLVIRVTADHLVNFVILLSNERLFAQPCHVTRDASCPMVLPYSALTEAECSVRNTIPLFSHQSSDDLKVATPPLLLHPCPSGTMSRSSSNRLRLASEIQRNGSVASSPCQYCFENNRECVVMSGNQRLRCSECVRRGRACVNLSWSSLDKQRESLETQVTEAEEELQRAIAKLLRLKKILKQANKRAAEKTECLEREMTETGELEEEAEDVDCPAAGIGVAASPLTWEMQWMIQDAVNNLPDIPSSSLVDPPS